jgi:phosphoserine aminotransferase
MLSFYPGPSQLEDGVKDYLIDAVDEGILQQNHRSEAFMSLYRYTRRLLQKRWNVPEDYLLVFSSSATEWWEIIAQSLTTQASVHWGNGAFAAKWFRYASAIHPHSRFLDLGLDNWPDPQQAGKGVELMAITHNETSNGTQVPMWYLRELQTVYPDALIAVDATSSIGGVDLDWSLADIWYGSVQKCLGLPAGMGLAILSPRAVEKAMAIGGHQYNALSHMVEQALRYQTHYTPNVLAVYLLMRVVKDRENIRKTSHKLSQRAEALYTFFETKTAYPPLISNPERRSETVICLQASEEKQEKLFHKASEKGILLGKGYGDSKCTTFRIANFPALKGKHFAKLKRILG